MKKYRNILINQFLAEERGELFLKKDPSTGEYVLPERKAGYNYSPKYPGGIPPKNKNKKHHHKHHHKKPPHVTNEDAEIFA